MNTQNPPPQQAQIALLSLKKFIVVASLLLVIALLALPIPGITGAILFFLCIPIVLWANTYFTKYHAARSPLPLVTYVAFFDPVLKSGIAIKVEISFQMPIGFNTSEITTRLNIASAAGLAKYCSELEETPTFEEIEESISTSIKRDVDELRLPVIRFHVLKVLTPPKPPKEEDDIPGIEIGYS